MLEKEPQNKEKQQELMMKLSMFEQQIQSIQQQLQTIEQTMNEFSILDLGLDDLKGSEGKEVLASIGRGIYTKAKITSEDLTVDVGNNTLVKKTIPETKDIIQKQIERLKEAKSELNKVMENISKEVQETIMDAQKDD